MPQKGTYPSHRVVNGVEMKYCGHCDRWLTLDSFHQKGHDRGYYHPCKSCRGKGPSPLLEYRPHYYKFMRLLVNRVGKAEASRIIGIEKSRVSTLMGRRPPIRIQRATARAIIEAYAGVTRLDIVISKKAIRHGAFERGKEAPRPKDNSDYYQRDGDLGNEMRRRYRALYEVAE